VAKAAAVESIVEHVHDPEVTQTTNIVQGDTLSPPEGSTDISEARAPTPQLNGSRNEHTDVRGTDLRDVGRNVKIRNQRVRTTGRRYIPSFSPPAPVTEIPADHTPIMRHIWDPLSSKHGISPAATPFATKEHDIPASVSVPLDEQQREGVSRLCSGDATMSIPIVSLVLGGAGTGKTTMIVAMVQWLTNNGTGSEPPCCYLVSRSEPGVKNIAEALESSGFHDYRVVVSDEKASNWYAQTNCMQVTSFLKSSIYVGAINCKGKLLKLGKCRRLYKSFAECLAPHVSSSAH
jgi:AAA domain